MISKNQVLFRNAVWTVAYAISISLYIISRVITIPAVFIYKVVVVSYFILKYIAFVVYVLAEASMKFLFRITFSKRFYE